MRPLLLLAAAVLLSAPPSRAAETKGDSGPSAQELAQFELLKQRMAAKQHISQSALGAAPPGVVVPPAAASPAPGSWQDEEEQRRTEFDKQFGPGAYQGIADFNSHCYSSDGCNKFAVGGILQGAYGFVDLQKDVERKAVEPGSDAYRSRHEAIKDGMRPSLEALRPTATGGRTDYQEQLIRVSDPIVKKIFTPQELLQYARGNAAAADSAPYYNYLGQTLNKMGPPGQAREAFDKALQKDPASEPALSGRAESRLNLRDYPGAAGDARSALSLKPDDAHAFTIMKFAQDRVAADPAASGAGAGPAADGAAGALGASAPSWGLASADAESARRSDALVAEAKRDLALGDAREAAQTLSKAVALNPANASALSLAAMAYNRLKDYASALAAAEAGLKLAPRSSPLLDAKAFALNGLKDYRGARAAAELALSINPYDPVAAFNRAAALAGEGDRDGELASLETAAKLDARFAPALGQARELPRDSDIMFLFPGEASESASAAPAAPSGAAPSRLGLAAGAVAAALLVLGAGVLLLKRPAAPPPRLADSRAAPSLIAGQYEIVAPIGSGGMGVVYAGRDRSLDRPVAIKRMREELRWDPRERARFLSEARLVARLKHPNVVGIHAIAEEGGEVYLIFEFVAGRTLSDVIAREGRLPFDRARDLFRGAAYALDFAHERGVIHRDLKPANVMVDGEGRVRVMDFGIARLAEEALSRATRTATVVGTPAYMAPEQEQGVARRESDVYSLAVCLYEALTGARPFEGTGAGMLMNKLKARFDPATARAAGLPPGLDAVLAKALDPSPDRRHPTAGAFLRDLEALEAPRPAI